MGKMEELARVLAKRKGGVYRFPYRHYTLKPNDSYFVTRRSACCGKGVHKDMIEIVWVRSFNPERLIKIPSLSPIKTYSKHTGFWICNKCDNLTSTYENYLNRAVKGMLKIFNPVFGFGDDQDGMGWALREMTTLQFRSWVKSRLATFWACSSEDEAKELGCSISKTCSWCSPEGKKKAKWLVRVKENNPNKSLDFWTGCPAKIDAPVFKVKKDTKKKMTRQDVRDIMKKEVQESVSKMDMSGLVFETKPKKKAKKKTKKTGQDVLDMMFNKEVE